MILMLKRLAPQVIWEKIPMLLCTSHQKTLYADPKERIHHHKLQTQEIAGREISEFTSICTVGHSLNCNLFVGNSKGRISPPKRARITLNRAYPLLVLDKRREYELLPGFYPPAGEALTAGRGARYNEKGLKNFGLAMSPSSLPPREGEGY